ncbi:hypothetical protein [Stieleria varia]|uniref:Cytochrome C n=1 Tax=Stieleria varia TaxID=2528005 RepID=A0A5C6B3E3_9BACT|nr:hypothetical protein [Stieleria varia]TWU06277.1 hypothetical protein Pla52n_19980 [Stieleria varia]
MQANELKSTIHLCGPIIRWLVVVLIVLVGLCDSQVTAQDSDNLPRRLEASHLPNPVQVHATVISGGLPEGDAAFKELAELGIKTIISVDGMKPDLEAAKKYGLRYVHLPHGYDGVPESRVWELAKAVQTLDGPVYIHCHHGKHRSPAAASVACVAAGLVKPEKAIEILELAGTNKNYVGLYQSARQSRPLPTAELSSFSPELPEVAEVPPMAEAMVGLGHTYEHIQLIAGSNWQTPKKHPDLDPVHEALLLREHYTELLRTPEVNAEPEEFKRMLRESESAARKLETLLSQWQASRNGQTLPAEVPAEIPAQAKIIADNCKACHVHFRDVPLNKR